MEQVQVDYVSVLMAAILYMVVGFFWYSKWLFGATWMKLAHVKESEMKHAKMAMAWGFLVALLMAYFIAFFQSYIGITSVADGFFVGFTLWLGFVMPTQITPVIWSKAPLKLFFIDTACKLVSLLVMSGVIAA